MASMILRFPSVVAVAVLLLFCLRVEGKRELLQASLYPENCNQSPPYTCEKAYGRWTCPGCSKCTGTRCYGHQGLKFNAPGTPGNLRIKQIHNCAKNPDLCNHPAL